MRKLAEFLTTVLATWFAGNVIGILLGYALLEWMRA